MPSFIDTATFKPGTRLRMSGLDMGQLEIRFVEPRSGRAMFSHDEVFDGEREGTLVGSVIVPSIVDEDTPPPEDIRLDGKIVEGTEVVYRLATGERHSIIPDLGLEAMLPGDTEFCTVWPDD